jgi:hypothetical protein
MRSLTESEEAMARISWERPAAVSGLAFVVLRFAEGLGIEQLVTAPIFFVFEFVSLFFARVLIVWLYAMTGQSALLVAIFHASFRRVRQ